MSNTSTGSTSTFDGAGVNISANTRKQTAVIYDVLSEGPIEGLVDNVASIRLNDNPVANSTNTGIIDPKQSFDGSYVASSGTVTDNQQNIFDGRTTAEGVRQIRIAGAKKRATGTISTVAGNNIITSSSSFFASNDVVTPGVLEPLIRIDGAGRDGGQLVAGITQFINTSAIRVDTTPMTTVSNTNAYIDLVDDIASYSGSTCTISPAGQGVNVANTIITMSSPRRSSTDTPVYNYQNFGYAFRTGTREQQYLPTPSGIGSASIAHAVSGGNLDTSSSSGYPSPSSFGFETPTEYTGSDLTITSSQMGVGNPEEVDQLKVTIGFNSMVSQKENGKLGPGFAEYRMTFGYSRDGGSTFTDVTKVGRSTIATSTSSYHKNGATKSSSSGVIRTKTRQPFNKVYTFDISRYQPFDAYRVKIERISAVNQKENSWQQTNAGTVKQIENVITDKLTYPYSAYAAVVVDAEDFQKVPKRSYRIRGLKVKVPTNYFPKDEINTSTGARRTSASYTRHITNGSDTGSVTDWDGNFRGDKKTFSSPTHANHEPVYTSNPVWIFFDLLTNQRYGLGKYLDEDFDFSQIDKYTLFQLAKYCDELVPDGKGGTEPRFTCNLYIQKDMDAIKMLKNMASMMRSMLVWYNGEVTLGTNMQKGAVYTFTKANVIEGAFSYSGSAGRFRNNQIAVTWNDPDNGYKQAVEVVEDHNEIARTGKYRRKNITAYGCTSQGQAIRHGKYQLLTEQLEREVVNFSTGINAGILKPGDIIDVQDPDLTDVVASGRVTTSSASSTTVIKTDRDLTSYLNNTDAFELHLIYPSGGAYLAQPLATINSTNYVQGDLILLDEDGAAINTHAKASNLKDDSGALVQTVWSEDVRVETQAISSFNASSVTVGTAFSSAPDGEVIYTISGVAAATGDDVTGSLRQFMVNSVKKDDSKGTYTISATEYHVEKYDAVDRGWNVYTYPEIARTPKRTDNVPAPTGLTASIVPAGGGDAEGDEFGINAYDVVLNWTLPTSIRTDENGNDLEDVYEHLAGFNIQHNMTIENEDYNENDFKTLQHNSSTVGSYTIRNVVPALNNIVRVQTVNTNGYTSGYIQKVFDFDASQVNPFGAGTLGGGLNGGIQKGGSLTATVDINTSTGAVALSNNTYVFTPPSGVAAKIITSGGTTTHQETAFSNMSNGDTAFLLMDYSDSSDCLKALQLVTDTTATDPTHSTKYNFEFLARLGESNNDLTAASGTISTTAGLPEVTGSSTTFVSDFSVGDVIAFQSAGANRFMAKVTAIESNTALTVDRGIPHAYSGVGVFKQGFTIDNLRDSVIGVVKKASGSFTYEPLTNKVKIDDSNEIADNTVNAAIIALNSVGSVQIATNSIGTAAIVSDAIDSSHISANSIDSAMIQAGEIDNSHISANSIDSAMIQANAIGSSEISANSIGSVAIAANAIGSSEIEANSIGTVAIAANSITSSQLTSNAVGSFTVTANSITAVEVASNAIGAAQIAANSIAAAEISANSIGSAEIKANSVNGTILLGNSVGSTQIAINSVNGLIISDGAIDSASKLASNIINSAKILTGAVEAQQLADNAVTTAAIAVNSVNTSELISDAVTGDIIAGNAVDTAQIKSDSIGSAAIIAGSIGNSEVAANAIDTNNIVADAIDSSHISANSINTNAIVTNSIDSSHISANSIGTNVIVSDAIDSSHIAANSIGTNAIVSDAIDNSHISANSIDSNMIVAGEIDSTHIGANQITAAAILAGTITNSQIAGNTINSAVIQANAVDTPQINADAITSAKIEAGAVDTAAIDADAVTNAKIAANAVQNAQIKAGAVENAQIAANAVQNAQIKADSVDNAQIAGNAVETAQIKSDNITTASMAGNAITNAKISSTDSMTLTVDGGTAGGWALTNSTFSAGSPTVGGDNYTNQGIQLNSAGSIHAKNFFIDSSGNAEFKGTIAGDSAVISGTLQTSNIQLGSFGANVSGTTIGSWNENDKNYREIGTIGTGAGVYMGTTSVTTTDTSLHQQSNTNGGFHQRLSNNVDYLISESRLFGTESGNSNRTFFTQPAIFKYEGTGTVKLYIYAEADGANNKKVGHVDYRFIKLGTTDPQFSFTNLVGQALSTTLYANSQVTGGFSGTKTVSISGGSAQFKIDNGTFQTGTAQISNGSHINVQMTSASSNQTTTTTTVTIGNTSSSWSITTGGTSGGGGLPGGGGGSPGGGQQGGGQNQGQQQASFVYGTNLTLSDGTEKRVEDIEVGDVLKSFKDTNLDENATNPHLSWTSKTLENASHGTCTVQGINIVEAESFYIINSRLHVTGTHYVLVLRGAEYSWKQVKDLQPGDYMIKDGLTLEKILSVQPFTNEVDVYTFDTETADSYIAEGVVVYDAEI